LIFGEEALELETVQLEAGGGEGSNILRGPFSRLVTKAQIKEFYY
jgi:hypothetical protein